MELAVSTRSLRKTPDVASSWRAPFSMGRAWFACHSECGSRATLSGRNFEGDKTVDTDIFRLVDHTHAAVAEFATIR
jgi:hypothetical protein